MKNKIARVFPGLASLAQKDAVFSSMRVCIVTPDLIGPVKNGGIGTACTNLAFALAGDGNKVEILFTQYGAEKGGDWVNSYLSKGIKVNFPPELANCKKFFPDSKPAIMAMRVYEWLKIQPEFNLILFMDWQGNGFYALHAKHCGLGFSDALMIIICHSPSIWQAINNAVFPRNPIEACCWHMERSSVELADAVISPSRYMLDWLELHGWHLPQKAYAQPNLLELECGGIAHADRPVREIVFFGRLEYRKGIIQFCEALDIMARTGCLPDKITFMGKCAFIGSEHCLLYIGRKARNWGNCEISLLLHFNHYQALEYLLEGGRLAVIPSVADNSPYTVFECLACHIPFLARNTGGVGELVAPRDRNRVLFGDNPHELACKINHAMNKKFTAGRLNFNIEENKAAWLGGLRAIVRLQESGETRILSGNEKPFISVCLTHYNRPRLLERALDSFYKQTYSNFEVILADDGSDSEEAKKFLDGLEPLFKTRGWQILRLENGFPARARNIAAEHARGSWLLFFDDDNLAQPHLLEVLAAAASRKNAALITSSFKVFHAWPPECEERFLPLGNMAVYSIIHNVIGDTASLIRKDVFQKYNGFSTDYGLGNEDFELYLRVALAGEKIGVIPEPLFWYRRNGADTVNSSTFAPANRMRSLRPFLEAQNPGFGELALMAHGLAESQNYCEAETPDIPQLHPDLDPQNPDLLQYAAQLLAAQGLAPFSRAVMEAIDNAKNEKSPEHGLLKKRLASLIAAKEEIAWEKVCGLLEQYCATDNGRLWGAGICRFILDNCSHWDIPRGRLCGCLQNWGAGDAAAWLCLAREYAPVNKEQAAIHFFHALAVAEKTYLLSRPDVKQAVANGVFVCGLHHYYLHGVREGALWPDARHFSLALEALAESKNMLAAMHAHGYHYSNQDLALQMINILCDHGILDGRAALAGGGLNSNG